MLLNIGSDYNTILLSRIVEQALSDALSRLTTILQRWGEKVNSRRRKLLKEEKGGERKRKRGENWNIFDFDTRSPSDSTDEKEKERETEGGEGREKKRDKMTRLNWRVRKDYLVALFSFIDFLSSGENILISPITASMLLQVSPSSLPLFRYRISLYSDSLSLLPLSFRTQTIPLLLLIPLLRHLLLPPALLPIMGITATDTPPPPPTQTHSSPLAICHSAEGGVGSYSLLCVGEGEEGAVQVRGRRILALLRGMSGRKRERRAVFLLIR